MLRPHHIYQIGRTAVLFMRASDLSQEWTTTEKKTRNIPVMISFWCGNRIQMYSWTRTHRIGIFYSAFNPKTQISPKACRYRFEIFDFWSIRVRRFCTSPCVRCIHLYTTCVPYMCGMHCYYRYARMRLYHTNEYWCCQVFQTSLLLLLLLFRSAFSLSKYLLMSGIINQMGHHFIDANVWWKNLLIEALTWIHAILYG